jgi:hypothetical protein
MRKPREGMIVLYIKQRVNSARWVQFGSERDLTQTLFVTARRHPVVSLLYLVTPTTCFTFPLLFPRPCSHGLSLSSSALRRSLNACFSLAPGRAAVIPLSCRERQRVLSLPRCPHGIGRLSRWLTALRAYMYVRVCTHTLTLACSFSHFSRLTAIWNVKRPLRAQWSLLVSRSAYAIILFSPFQPLDIVAERSRIDFLAN